MEVTRTLVKSPPELWAELSDVAALARHLGEFGTIRIVRTEPESVVEWEGDRASGSVRLEPAGWGTRVTLTAEPVAAASSSRRSLPPLSRRRTSPGAPTSRRHRVTLRRAGVGRGRRRGRVRRPAAAPPRRRGFWARLFRRRDARGAARRGPATRAASPAARRSQPPEPGAAPPPPAAVAPPLDEAAVLAQALHALGSAHHRPFSR